MLLAIDIGNTNIMMGVFKDAELAAIWRISTSVQRTIDEYCIIFNELFESSKIPLNTINGIIIASVASPKVLGIVRNTLNRLFSLHPLIVGENIDVPIKNLYNNPSQVGQDRLVSAFSAYRQYGGPVIVIDFGTAITFDLVSKEGEYLGGLIAPGIEISFDALIERTTLLPKIELVEPDSLLGKDTVTSMRSGVINGFSSLCDGVIHKLKEEFGRDIPTVVTGGNAELIASHCTTIDNKNPYLILEGLQIIYSEKNQSL